MPSSQHKLLKLTLDTISYSLRFRLDIEKVRQVLEWRSKCVPMLKEVSYHQIDLNYIKSGWLSLQGSNSKKVILYLHGGAYALGSSETHKSFVAYLVKGTGFNAIIPNYRKSPEHPFPAALDDALHTYQWLLQKYAPSDIIIAGDSAGAGLAVALQIAIKHHKHPLPAASILLSPYVDLLVTGESVDINQGTDKCLPKSMIIKWAKIYAGGFPVNHPLISPLYADLSDLPPMLIQVSKSEVLFDDARRLYDKAKDQGVKATLQMWDGLVHWWHLYPNFLPEAKDAIEKICAFSLKYGDGVGVDNEAVNS